MTYAGNRCIIHILHHLRLATTSCAACLFVFATDRSSILSLFILGVHVSLPFQTYHVYPDARMPVKVCSKYTTR